MANVTVAFWVAALSPALTHALRRVSFTLDVFEEFPTFSSFACFSEAISYCMQGVINYRSVGTEKFLKRCVSCSYTRKVMHVAGMTRKRLGPSPL